MARRLWPGEDPIGRRISIGFYGAVREREIVGVVADIRQSALDTPPEATIYLPHAQVPSGGITMLLRSVGEPRMLARELKRAVAELDPQIPVTGMTTLDEVVADSLKARRFTLLLFGCFAVAALLLAVIGVYGVISHATAERSKEFGVRIALGAQRSDIIVMVIRQGLTAAGIGLAVGILAAAGLTTLLSGMLFGVTPFDALTFVGVSMLMLTTAVIACYLPARRATTVPPVVALRVS
jgi:putative ABC transport system permease protein